MEIFKPLDVIGDAIELKATNFKHFGFNPDVRKTGETGFAGELAGNFKAEMAKVNELQLTSEEMTRKLAVSPDEVNIHDVMIASEKAQLALNFTKTIRDKLINAYQTLVNLR